MDTGKDTPSGSASSGARPGSKPGVPPRVSAFSFPRPRPAYKSKPVEKDTDKKDKGPLPTEIPGTDREGRTWVVSANGTLKKCKYLFGKYECPTCGWVDGNPKRDKGNKLCCTTCSRVIDLVR